MAEITAQPPLARPAGGRTKFLIGGAILLAAVAYLIITGVTNNSGYFTTVDEVTAEPDRYVGRRMKLSGVVIGDSIEYDGHTLSFDIVNLDNSKALLEDDKLAQALHEAASTSTDAERITIVLQDEPKPDLLKHEAQAIVEGRLVEQADGSYVFEATTLLLKCPTRYEEAVPDQASGY